MRAQHTTLTAVDLTDQVTGSGGQAPRPKNDISRLCLILNSSIKWLWSMVVCSFQQLPPTEASFLYIHNNTSSSMHNFFYAFLINASSDHFNCSSDLYKWSQLAQLTPLYLKRTFSDYLLRSIWDRWKHSWKESDTRQCLEVIYSHHFTTHTYIYTCINIRILILLEKIELAKILYRWP